MCIFSEILISMCFSMAVALDIGLMEGLITVTALSKA
jgi:hypothetical protein